jgi:hypothetical protein
MKTAERKFLKNCNRHDRLLRNEFVVKRKIFMRELRKCERRYWQQQLRNLEDICINDPKTFWWKKKELGPQKI